MAATMPRRQLPPAVVIAITSFSFACLAFILTTTLVIPVTGALSVFYSLPAAVPQMLIPTELVVIPIAAAVLGVDVGRRILGELPDES